MQTEIAYLTALKQQCVEEFDEQVRYAQCHVHQHPQRKATITLTVVVEHNDETDMVVTEYKTRLAHTHKDPQAIDATERRKE